MRILRYLWPVALACATPAYSQDGIEQVSTLDLRTVEANAQTIAEIFLAERTTEQRLTALTSGSLPLGYYGNAVIPAGHDGVWRVVYLISDGQDLAVDAEFEVAEGQILSEAIYPADARPPASALARNIAIAQVLALGAVYPRLSGELCLRRKSANSSANAASFSFVTLPPTGEGKTTVYVLNGPFDTGFIPLGKHYRVLVDPKTQSVEATALSSSCGEVALNKDRIGDPVTVEITEPADAVAPVEMSAFLSNLLPKGSTLNVRAGSEVWPIVDGIIGSPHPASANSP